MSRYQETTISVSKSNATAGTIDVQLIKIARYIQKPQIWASLELACPPACSRERLTEIAQESDRPCSMEGPVNPKIEDLVLNPVY